jgi:hypothetical protein
MDRINYSSYNIDHYCSQYSQIHQEDGQHTSQPETGQTHGGVAAGGPSWSQSESGQPQPYQSFNFPAQIPPLLGSDLDSFQPIPLENIIQNGELAQPSNPQPAVRKRKRRSSAEVKEHFLAGLDNYARGVKLKSCSANLSFKLYLNDSGELTAQGRSLYKSLMPGEQTRVCQAINSRVATVVNPIKSFLGGLEAYASGAQLKDCSATIRFAAYVTTKGVLQEMGVRLYERLNQGDKDRVDQALAARRRIQIELIANNDTPMDCFLEGLEAYANGASLSDCSATIRYANYVTTDGRLLAAGKRLHNRLVGGAGEALVDKALAARRKIAAQRISGDLPYFLAALVSYGNGLDLHMCGEASAQVKRFLTPEGGLTPKGELLIENLSPDQQNDVWDKITERRQRLDPSAQVPDLQWQLPEIPSSMSEMEMLAVRGMSQAAMVDPMQTEAMVDPMQTEAMWAAVWQMTGQAMPGTWEIPSESAEPPMPSYDNEAFGADFQHHYGAYADQYPGQGV